GNIGDDGIRHRRGFKTGIRPLRERSPYAYASYNIMQRNGKELFNLHGRMYYEHWSDPLWELVGEFRVLPQIRWSLDFGVKFRQSRFESDIFREGSRVKSYVGIHGPLGKFFKGYLGAGFPWHVSLGTYGTW
ncbi:MAG: hypothetical protein Q7R88_00210, partial [bacterium]|nr:hypothetical protein [bacterium]